MSDPRLEAIQDALEPLMEGLGLEIIELSKRKQGRGYELQVLVDAIGGVNLERCAKANRVIRQALEEAGLLNEDEALEVASPGLDRLLKTDRDFERTLGEQLDVTYCDDAGTEHRLKAMVLAVQGGSLILKQDGATIQVALKSIRKATKALPW